MLDKDNREGFFEKSFLLADIKPDTVFGMPFLIISNADIDFQAQDLQQRFYTTENVFPTIKQVKLIKKKEFAAVVLYLEYEIFVIYIAALSINLGDKMYSLKRAQIAHLKANEAPIKLPKKCANFVDVFSPKLAAELLEYGINHYAIKQIDNW